MTNIKIPKNIKTFDINYLPHILKLESDLTQKRITYFIEQLITNLQKLNIHMILVNISKGVYFQEVINSIYKLNKNKEYIIIPFFNTKKTILIHRSPKSNINNITKILNKIGAKYEFNNNLFFIDIKDIHIN